MDEAGYANGKNVGMAVREQNVARAKAAGAPPRMGRDSCFKNGTPPVLWPGAGSPGFMALRQVPLQDPPTSDLEAAILAADLCLDAVKDVEERRRANLAVIESLVGVP